MSNVLTSKVTKNGLGYVSATIDDILFSKIKGNTRSSVLNKPVMPSANETLWADNVESLSGITGINAVDIDWNGATPEQDVVINSTGELLSWIKNKQGTPGAQGVQGAAGKSAYDLYKDSINEHGAIYSFTSWSLDGNTAYGEGTVEVIEQRLGGATVKVLTNTDFGNNETNFVGMEFDVQQPLNEGDLIQLYIGDEPQQIAVRATLQSEAVVAMTQSQWLESLKGANGVQGAEGAEGPQGAEGAEGPQGAEGAQGPQGDQGTQGADGPQGAQGVVGPQGKSVYEVYLDTVPSGTQALTAEEWLATLKGPQGDQGANGSGTGEGGAQGYQGPQGDQGPKGDQGYQGAEGPQGDPGSIDTTILNNKLDKVKTIELFNSNETLTIYNANGNGNNPFYIENASISDLRFKTENSSVELFIDNESKGIVSFEDAETDEYDDKAIILGYGLISNGIIPVDNNGWLYVDYSDDNNSIFINTNITVNGETLETGTVHNIKLVEYTPYDDIISTLGIQGPQGYQGDSGVDGNQGAQGYQGPKGDQGYQGNDGVQGKSAYELYLDTVEEGVQALTVEEWLASLKGPQGDQGAAGEGGGQGSGLTPEQLESLATKQYVDNLIGQLGVQSEAVAAVYSAVENGTTLAEGKTYYTSISGAGEFVSNGTEVSDGTNYFELTTPASPAVPYSNVIQVITDNEEVMAAALADLNSRIGTLTNLTNNSNSTYTTLVAYINYLESRIATLEQGS